MMTISLKDLQFRAFHGIHEEEKTLGNDYIVNCHAHFHVSQSLIEDISETVNYQALFELIREEMQLPTPLLETLCMRIEQVARQQFPRLSAFEISIQKLRPPIVGFTGSSAVTWRREFTSL